MANPQLEDGYTRIANSLYEALYKINLTATELRVVACIIRRTFGYGRKSRELSATYINSDTGIPIRSVERALSHLQELKIIIRINSEKKGVTSELAINKDFESWVCWSKTTTVTDGGCTTVTDGGCTTVTDGGCTTVTDGGRPPSRMADNKETYKKNNKEIYIVEQSPTSDVFQEVIDYLNQRTGKRFRPENKTTRRHINARIKDGYCLEDLKRVIDLKAGEWMGTEMEKYLRPETLFAGKFEGYLNACPAAVQKKIAPAQEDEEPPIDLWSCVDAPIIDFSEEVGQ